MGQSFNFMEGVQLIGKSKDLKWKISVSLRKRAAEGVDKVWPPQMAPPYGPHNGPPWKNDNIR